MFHKSPLGYASFSSAMLVLFSLFFLCSNSIMALSRNLHDDLRATWGDGRCKIINDGKLFSVALDKESGSGFESKKEYLFAKIDIEIKLVSGNSAGTVTAYYVRIHHNITMKHYFTNLIPQFLNILLYICNFFIFFLNCGSVIFRREFS